MSRHKRPHAEIVRPTGAGNERLCSICAEWKHEASSYYLCQGGRYLTLCIPCEKAKRRATYVKSNENAKTYARRHAPPHPDQPCALADALGYCRQLTKGK